MRLAGAQGQRGRFGYRARAPATAVEDDTALHPKAPCHDCTAMRRLFPVTGPDDSSRRRRPPLPTAATRRTASGASTSWPTPTRTPSGPGGRRLAARQHGVHARRRRPARRPLAAASPAPPTCGSSARCGGWPTWWSSARRRYARRATARPAPGRPSPARRAAAGQGPAPGDRGGQREPGPGLLAAAVHLAAGADPRADRCRGAPADRVAAARKAGAEVVIAGDGHRGGPGAGRAGAGGPRAAAGC